MKVREAMAKCVGEFAYNKPWDKLTPNEVISSNTMAFYILSIREDGCRLAIVKEKGELPDEHLMDTLHDICFESHEDDRQVEIQGALKLGGYVQEEIDV